MDKKTKIQLGCGLIRIGREWGFRESTVPTETEVNRFLTKTVEIGIRYFDTAPAYGSSEKRLGNFLKTLPDKTRQSLTIATKCGELWDEFSHETTVDHSYASLKKSIDNSLQLLSKIDILQIHKATNQVLQSPDVKKALDYAKSLGITQFGASISDADAANVVVDMEDIAFVQLPYNAKRIDMHDAIHTLKAKGKYIVINRPFNMGSIAQRNEQKKSKQEQLIDAYKFIIKEDFSGVILTGTANSDHLQENLEAFQKACHSYEKE